MDKKELAKQSFDDILEPFEATDIKHLGEYKDEYGYYYIANIVINDDSKSKIDKLVQSNNAEFIDNGEYLFNTEYGYCNISDDGDQYTIECGISPDDTQINDEDDDLEESLITIDEEVDVDENEVYNTKVSIDKEIIDVTITEDPDGVFYNVYVNENIYLQEPKNTVKNIKLLAFDSAVDAYKDFYFNDRD